MLLTEKLLQKLRILFNRQLVKIKDVTKIKNAKKLSYILMYQAKVAKGRELEVLQVILVWTK